MEDNQGLLKISRLGLGGAQGVTWMGVSMPVATTPTSRLVNPQELSPHTWRTEAHSPKGPSESDSVPEAS